MAASRIGATAEANVVDAVAAGELRQITIEDAERRRIAELLHQYADLHGGQGLSIADASVIAVAEHGASGRSPPSMSPTSASCAPPRPALHAAALTTDLVRKVVPVDRRYVRSGLDQDH